MPNNITSDRERIVALETGQKSLTDNLQKLADIVSEQSEIQTREHGQTRREIHLLSDKLGAVGKPNYGVIIAACSLVCMLVAAVLAPFHLQQQNNSSRIEKLEMDFHRHEMLPSHPVSGAIFDEREKAYLRETALDEKLNQAREELLRAEMKAKP